MKLEVNSVFSQREFKMSQKKTFSYWINKNKYYHNFLLSIYRFIVPQGASVLHINCKNGYFFDALKPSLGFGVDADPDEIAYAQKRYPEYQFYCGTLEDVSPQTFDYIILSAVTLEVYDIQQLFERLQKFCSPKTRIVVATYSYLWEPILWFAQKLGLRRPTVFKNWISQKDLQTFFSLSDFEVVTTSSHILLPMYIPLISTLCNRFLAHLPLIRKLCLHDIAVVRPLHLEKKKKEYSVSVIVPCKNEKGNIESAVARCPHIGRGTEIIFIEGDSCDGTAQEIDRVIKQYPEKNIRFICQDGKGKGDAVRKGFAHAKGDIFMILDADLTVPPEELPKFYIALIQNKGEFINGSRLVYGMESQAMRTLNLFVNYSFGLLFSWLLGQKLKDTLCGTKVLFRLDYQKIVDNRAYFGDFDPFGDFDLLFGAAKLNLKLVDMPVHYKNRAYGVSQIQYFKNGLILLGMSCIALKKFKWYK